ncbi:TPA: biopolymer transporter ExbD [Candidatus Poribacteria bacterium]|nr:biopolymer transporter ExbD [Candidatus Poribacteria bacterium]HIB92627.1 biopolymer transporter ExbD [Candidatus Poribacteria bacterium]HIO07111.1 biopolymer transporter ExbD [Candidatus Poribacteria bacterium]
MNCKTEECYMNDKSSMRSSRSKKSVEMDMAPMIDCVFLLLIFFMVSTTFAPMPGIRVQLPPPGKPNPNKPKGLIIRIANPEMGQVKGVMVLNDEIIEYNDIYTKLLNQPDEIKSMLIIQSERDVLHEQIIKVIDLAKQAGIVGVGFAVVARE